MVFASFQIKPGPSPNWSIQHIYTRPVIFAPLKEAGFQRIMCNPQWTVPPLILPLVNYLTQRNEVQAWVNSFIQITVQSNL